MYHDRVLRRRSEIDGHSDIGVWMQATKTAVESNELSLRAFKEIGPIILAFGKYLRLRGHKDHWLPHVSEDVYAETVAKLEMKMSDHAEGQKSQNALFEAEQERLQILYPKKTFPEIVLLFCWSHKRNNLATLMSEDEQKLLEELLPQPNPGEQRTGAIIDTFLFKVFKIISTLRGAYAKSAGRAFPMWLDDHAVKQADENVKQAEEDVKQAEEDAAELACEDPVKLAKLMRMKRHSRARNDIQYENCGVVLLMWDLLLEYLTGIEIAIESLEGLRRDVIACLRSKFIKAAVRARAQVFVNLLHLLRVLTKHNTINSSMLDMGELHLPILDKAVRDGANGMSKMSTRGLYLFEHCKLKQIVEKFRSSKMGVLDVVFGTEEEELVVRFHQAHMLGVLVDREKRYRNFFGDQLPAGYGHPQGKFFESTGPLRVTLSASRPDSDIVEGSFD